MRDRIGIIALFAGTLGLAMADQAAVGVVAPSLKADLGLDNTQLGLLVTVSAFVGAAAAIPAGSLVDRLNRRVLLVVGVTVWSIAEAALALSDSFLTLVLIRLGLGAILALALPAVASLTGDFFPGRDRARAYGFITTGELVGAGVGFLLAGLVSAWLGWRLAFVALSLPGPVLAWAIHRHLPEPRSDPGWKRPRPPRRVGLRQAARLTFSIRTNVVMVIASSLGYFFFAALRTFGLLFLRAHFGVGQVEATLLLLAIGVGAIAGLIASGRLSDVLGARGYPSARIVVGGAGYLATAALVAPAVLSGSLVVGLPLLVLGAAALALPNPSLDAARLDVVPGQIWGRAEGIRTFVRDSAEASAPLLMGVLSDAFGGGGTVIVGSTGERVQAGGLVPSLLLLLIPTAAAGVMLLLARAWYPPDVRRAASWERRQQDSGRG